MKTIVQLVQDIEKYSLSAPSYSMIYDYHECANGCGAKNGLKFPKTMWFVNIEATCYIHDIRWELATCYQDLVEANEEFDDNLKRICDQESNWFMKRVRRQRLAKYINEVELIGLPSYAKERGFNK